MAKDIKAVKLSAKEEAIALLNSRKPNNNKIEQTFRLKQGVFHFLSPKFTFIGSNGEKLKVRYCKEFNSIFEDEQDSFGDPILIERISLESHSRISDKALVDFLLLSPAYGERYTVLDLNRNAEAIIASEDFIDELKMKLREMKSEELKALTLLVMPSNLSDINSMSIPELRLALRDKIAVNPKEVAEAMENPILKTLYLFHMATALGEVRCDNKNGTIVWADSGKVIMKVPENKEPSTFFARGMLDINYASVRELLESKIGM